MIILFLYVLCCMMVSYDFKLYIIDGCVIIYLIELAL